MRNVTKVILNQLSKGCRMKRLTAVILVLLVGVAALVGCAKKGPTETIDQPQDALALLVESKDSETGITIYINQRSDLLTGAYFYPYLEKVGDDLRLRIRFHYYDKGTWLNVSRYTIEADGVSYSVTFDADTDKADYEQIDGGTADIMDILADEDEIAILKAVAVASEAKITAFGMDRHGERLVSDEERIVTQEVLSAYEQMTSKASTQ